MFHPYWAIEGQPPRDMIWPEKRICRNKYRQLIRKHRIAIGLPIDDEVEEYNGQKVIKTAEKETMPQSQNEAVQQAHDKPEAGPPNLSVRPDTLGQSDAKSKTGLDILTGPIEMVPGGSEYDPMVIDE